MSSDDVSELSAVLAGAPVVELGRLPFLRGGGSMGGMFLFPRGRSCRTALASDGFVDTTATPTNGSSTALLEKSSISFTASLEILVEFLEVREESRRGIGGRTGIGLAMCLGEPTGPYLDQTSVEPYLASNIWTKASVAGMEVSSL